MFVYCEYCVLPGRGLGDELITRLEESYRLWCVVMCNLETWRMRRPWPALGRSATGKKCIRNCSNKTHNLFQLPSRCEFYYCESGLSCHALNSIQERYSEHVNLCPLITTYQWTGYKRGENVASDIYSRVLKLRVVQILDRRAPFP